MAMAAKTRIILLLVLALLSISMPQNALAGHSIIVSPSAQTVSQGSLASYTVSLSGGLLGATYAYSLAGAYLASYDFSPDTTSGVSGSTTLTIDTSFLPAYCPGSYAFTVVATNTGLASDTASASATLSVLQVGPPLSVNVSTDKTSYKRGDPITIRVTATRPVEGVLIVRPPSGASSSFPFEFLTPPFSGTKTVTASEPYGTWTASVQADDFCSGVSSASTSFLVGPDTYDVSVSLSGVPSQFSAGLQVDGENKGTVPGSGARTLSFPVQTTHTITVDQYVPGDTGVRYYCAQNTWTVSGPDSRTFSYETQYEFTVTTDPSDVTSVTGGGWFSAGANVQTNEVPQIVAANNGTQYVFKYWEVDGAPHQGNPVSLTMNAPHTAVAKYVAQYLLVVNSQYGNPQGGGYYDAGSTAAFSVTSPVGFLIQQVFDHWEGDYSGTSPQGSLMMNGPKTIHAVWRTDYTQLYIVVGAAVIIVLLILLAKRARHPGSSERKAPEHESKKDERGSHTES